MHFTQFRTQKTITERCVGWIPARCHAAMVGGRFPIHPCGLGPFTARCDSHRLIDLLGSPTRGDNKSVESHTVEALVFSSFGQVGIDLFGGIGFTFHGWRSPLNPWEWYIYSYGCLMFNVNIGKYTNITYMDLSMGLARNWTFIFK